MSDTAWLFVAMLALWLGIGAYLASLGVRQRKLEKRMRELEETRGHGSH